VGSAIQIIACHAIGRMGGLTMVRVFIRPLECWSVRCIMWSWSDAQWSFNLGANVVPFGPPNAFRMESEFRCRSWHARCYTHPDHPEGSGVLPS
jgi:hypothetical protein